MDARGLLLLAGLLSCLLWGQAAPAASHSPVRNVKYGAIAMDRDSKAIGYSYDFISSRDAKREALRLCGTDNCEVLVSIRNACGVVAEGKTVADGKTKLWTETGATRQEAQTKVLRQCGKGCPILAWACTR